MLFYNSCLILKCYNFKMKLNLKKILDKKFETVINGYSPTQVDTFLDLICFDYNEYNEIISLLNLEINKLSEEINKLNKDISKINIKDKEKSSEISDDSKI